MTDETSLLNEIRQRTTRIESRLCRLGEKLGVPVREARRELTLSADCTTLHTRALDVAVSDCVHFLHDAGVKGIIVPLIFGGEQVAAIHT